MPDTKPHPAHPTTTWHALSADEVLHHLKSAPTGLSGREISERTLRFGKNELPEVSRRSAVTLFFKQFVSPLIYLLLLAAGIAWVIGEAKDSIVILIVVILNSLIGAFQEDRAERSLRALRNFSKLRARTVRDGKEQLIDASALVPGDCVILTAGDAVPADARLLEARQLTLSEAALSGESLPIHKDATALPLDTLLPDRRNMVYAGTFVHTGRCVAIVTATGIHTEIGKIAQLAGSASQPKTNLERKIHQFGNTLILVSIPVCLAVILVGWLRGIALSEIFMVAISQMVSLVPEGLPVAMTIALAVGVQRMAKKGTVIRKLSAVEALGSTTVICSDKTGTLTRNEMTVTRVFTPSPERMIEVSGLGYSPEGSFISEQQVVDASRDAGLSELALVSALCNDAELLPPTAESHGWRILGDPTEGALLVFSAKAGCDPGRARNEHPRIGEIPFDSRFKMMTTRNQVHGSEVLFLKGAPEVILEQCDTFRAASSASKLTPELRLRILSLAHEMAESALRVLAFARIDEGFEHRDLTFENLPKKAIFLGLIGQMDPPRSEVAQAVKETEAAGIKTVMITGDHQATGAAIASMLGIKGNQDEVIDGPSLQLMSDGALRERIERIRVFARVLPAQKLRIIEAFQHRGHIVAMTGDGVNDAPALVKADVGVSMGITGSEVAKEAAKIVISDDNFATLVAAVGEGRLVHQNIKKLLLFLFVTSLDEVAILFLALLFGYPVPLAAVQILWINLVTEGTLTLNLIMEPAEGNEMRRPPVPKDEALLDPALLRRIPLMVLSSVGSTFGWMIYRTHEGAPLDLVRTETFTMLAVCQWFNVLNCRSAIQSAISSDLLKNPWLIGGLILGNLLHLAVIYWPPLQGLFHTVPIEGSMFLAMVGVASWVLWVEEIRKLRARRALSETSSEDQG